MISKDLRYKNIQLALDLAVRDIATRYKRSILGLGWLFLTPLALLGLYSIVFGGILGIRWVDESGVSVGYSLPMLVGLVMYLFFADLVNSSASLFVQKRTLVVKSPFPIWILWASNFIRCIIMGAVSFSILLAFALWSGVITLHGLAFACIVMLPSILFLSAISLILSVLGPFIGDISQSIGLGLRVLFYAGPITYPITNVPSEYRDLLWLNPLTNIVEPLRQAIVFGVPPHFGHMAGFAAISLVMMLTGVWMFKRAQGVIPDVV